jgi:hypothetical protein
MGKELTGREAMNKIVREHYPAAKLPEDLREGLDADAKVRVVVEVEGEPRGAIPAFPERRVRDQPMTIEETKDLISKIRAQDRPSVSTEEAVARIRELRDEWDY